MSEKDVVENVDSPGEIAIPYADNNTPGIASFDSKDFTVDPNGKVSSIVERGIPQYLGKITGTGTGTTDLNWEVDWKSRPTIVTNGKEEVDKAKRIKPGEYIMLTEHFNQFLPGDIFRITSVQIEGSKYTVKTNNVKVLSLASIVGPQGEQGEQGSEGRTYLAYSGNINVPYDPYLDETFQLLDGNFNRTPIIGDTVTLDWHNNDTNKSYMITGVVTGRISEETNDWDAIVTAISDITGAVGPQGEEGAGIKDIVDIDYPYGEFINVQYDTIDGIKMQGIAKYLRDNGEIYEIPTNIDVPFVAGDGISIDKKEAEEKVEVKSLNSNLENADANGSIQQKDFIFRGSGEPGGRAYGAGSQSFGRAAKSYQCASFAAGNTVQSGMTEAEFNAYYWNSEYGKPSHNGKGKDADGNVLDATGYKYSESYAATATFGEDNKSIGRALFTAGQSNRNTGTCNAVSGKANNVDGIINIVHGESTAVTGSSNSIFAHNSNINANRVSAIGNQLAGNYGNQTILGYLNRNAKENLLELGCGQPILRVVRFNADFTNSDEIIIKPYYPSKPCTICISVVHLDNYIVGGGKSIFVLNGSQYFSTETIDGEDYLAVGNVYTSNPLVIKPKYKASAISISCFVLQNKSASGNYQNFGVYVRHNGTDTYKADIVNSYLDSQKNAFEVLWDGRAKIYGAPKDNNDIIRKQEYDIVSSIANTASTTASDASEKAKTALTTATNTANALGKITYISGSSSTPTGNISTKVLNDIISNEYNLIEFLGDKEVYYLSKKDLSSGTVTYTHVGNNNGVQYVKTLTFTLSTDVGSPYVITTTALGSGDASSVVGEAVIPSGATNTATKGTFTSTEWTKLQANKNNYILFNNEIYRLADTGHEGTPDIWSYVHSGWDGAAMQDKSINVTISTGAWALVVGAQLTITYRHQLTFTKTVDSKTSTFTAVVYSSNSISVDSLTDLKTLLGDNTIEVAHGTVYSSGSFNAVAYINTANLSVYYNTVNTGLSTESLSGYTISDNHKKI